MNMIIVFVLLQMPSFVRDGEMITVVIFSCCLFVLYISLDIFKAFLPNTPEICMFMLRKMICVGLVFSRTMIALSNFRFLERVFDGWVSVLGFSVFVAFSISIVSEADVNADKKKKQNTQPPIRPRRRKVTIIEEEDVDGTY